MSQQKIEYARGNQVEDLAYASDATSLGSAEVLVIFADGLTKQERCDALEKIKFSVFEQILPND